MTDNPLTLRWIKPHAEDCECVKKRWSPAYFFAGVDRDEHEDDWLIFICNAPGCDGEVHALADGKKRTVASLIPLEGKKKRKP